MQRQIATMKTAEAPDAGADPGPFIGVRGAAFLETAVTLPIIVMICVGVVEFGRAYQTWQVLTNAAREGARVATVRGSSDREVESAVRSFMAAEQLGSAGTAPVAIKRQVAFGSKTATEVTIQYPFSFILLDPAVRFVRPVSTTGAPLTMSAVAILRNES